MNKIGMTEYLEAALRASSLKQNVIANNIANVDTPGFRRGDVPFARALAKAMQAGDADPAGMPLEIVTPGTTAVDANGNDVNLDMEVGELIKNSNASKAYLKLLNKIYQQMQLAITGG